MYNINNSYHRCADSDVFDLNNFSLQEMHLKLTTLNIYTETS